MEETTGALLLKGSTREVIKRHANTLIFLFRPDQDQDELSDPSVPSTPLTEPDSEPEEYLDQTDFHQTTNLGRPKRKAAQREKAWLKDMIEEGLV